MVDVIVTLSVLEIVLLSMYTLTIMTILYGVEGTGLGGVLNILLPRAFGHIYPTISLRHILART